MDAAAIRRSAARFLMIGFDGPALTPTAASLLRQGVFGAILFTRNYRDRGQVAELCDAIKECRNDEHDLTPAIAVDHEGGRVQRFRGPGFTDTLPMRDVGMHLDGAEERAEAIGRLFAAELRPLGIDIDFAPVVDVDSNPANPVIGERSFSSDPAVVGRLGAAFIQGLQSGGVAACAKHFPGHGDTAVDSHLDLPRLPHGLTRLREIELPPFEAAVKANVASVMTSHILFTSLDKDRPATMSPEALSILRRDMRYTGVIVSDDLEMKAIAAHYDVPSAAIDAINAGCDLLLACHTGELQETLLDAIASAVGDGRIPADRVLDAELRRAALVRKFVR
jgi:beta-N-acetylhexosaminidase